MRAIHSVFQRAGFDVIRWPQGTARAVDFARLTDATGADVVVDVGANRGQFALTLRARGYTGRIVSFEPLAGPFEELARTAEADRAWDAYRLALGRMRGEATMQVPADSSLASILPLTDRGREHFAVYLHDLTGESVAVDRLDNVWDGLVRGDRAVLKVDVQGAEAAVLEGTEGVMARILGAQIEMSVAGYYEGAADYLDTLRSLRAAGFEAAAFNPVSWHDGIVGELDVIVARAGLMPGLSFR